MEGRRIICPGLTLVLAFVFAPLSQAYPFYQTAIPNAGIRSSGVASTIPAPFGTANKYCQSVGHKSKCDGAPSDGGNPFGTAFRSAGGTWTKSVCMADSDGDGVSNGAEIGDPNCIWTPGAAPEKTTGLSHPGFSCSTAANPFCVGDAVKPSTGDDDSESIPSWEAAVGCAVAIFAIKYILAVVAAMQEEPAASKKDYSDRRDSKANLQPREMENKAAEDEEAGSSG